MTYRIEFTDVADKEIHEILFWMIGRSPERAGRWQEGLEESVYSLSEHPRRCALAPEDKAFPVEIRQKLYGVFRILFTLVDADGDGQEDTVRILHIRHGARRFIHETDRNGEEDPV
ncbi:MAG: type II toxin-antitoxin system RelE/ParE family toxin [Armatimonadetes bacterium]|nr:type II toxin-antitoxin system RelE/ParE family toxin [Armatimonadota bacterium]